MVFWLQMKRWLHTIKNNTMNYEWNGLHWDLFEPILKERSKSNLDLLDMNDNFFKYLSFYLNFCICIYIYITRFAIEKCVTTWLYISNRYFLWIYFSKNFMVIIIFFYRYLDSKILRTVVCRKFRRNICLEFRYTLHVSVFHPLWTYTTPTQSPLVSV